jgi:hypothetical protein
MNKTENNTEISRLNVNMNGKDVVYDDNEPQGADPHLIVPLNVTIATMPTLIAEHINY